MSAVQAGAGRASTTRPATARCRRCSNGWPTGGGSTGSSRAGRRGCCTTAGAGRRPTSRPGSAGRSRRARRPPTGAAFVEGFLAGSGTVLLHDVQLLTIVDAWVASLRPDAFEDIVALLRRTFGAFEPAERRQLGVLLATGRVERVAPMGDDIDEARGRAGLATVRAMLGLAPARGTTVVTDELDGSAPARVSDTERMRRWRLVLGGGDADGTGAELGGDDRRIDGALGGALRPLVPARPGLGPVRWAVPLGAGRGPLVGRHPPVLPDAGRAGAAARRRRAARPAPAAAGAGAARPSCSPTSTSSRCSSS